MARKHFLLILLFMLIAAPLAITGRIPVSDALAQALSGGGTAANARSNIRNTRHNLSSSAPSRQATSGNSSTTEAIISPDTAQTQEICIYCHTPHGATPSPGTPLWNRALNNTTYTPYSSSSLQATDLDVTSVALAAPSKLCLSCHDGTIAIGQVNNAPGSGYGSPISLKNTSDGSVGSTTGKMPFGREIGNANHGFTRNLGTDLRNDHPISFTYDSSLASADGELRYPSGSTSPTIIANRGGGVKPHFPLTGGKVQCTTCHDPHKETQKFLRKNRFAQNVGPETTQTTYSDWAFSDTNDQICVACHTRLGKAWAMSAHANSAVADEAYNSGDAALRDFPTGTTVWQAGCLNCHDTHTVGGSRRLLREGVGSGLTLARPGGYTGNYRPGYSTAADYDTTSAIENTCYQCHSGSPVIGTGTLSATQGVPNIAGEFARTIRMPIVTGEQGLPGGNTTEVHDITDKDTIESRDKLGYYAKENRHVECTDCHNPHRVVKADNFLGANLAGADTTRRTHVPARGTTGNQGNIASGVLRGTWGVEPSYTATGQTTVTGTSVWMSAAENPTFTVKKGDPGAAATLPVGTAGTNAVTYLTREYQLCFKCHSSYANGPLKTDFPDLRASGNGGTPTGTNLMTRYTNVAAEFAVWATDPPTTGKHQGENTNAGNACGGGDCAPTGNSWETTTGGSTINHRSWHPVVFPTGRDGRERGSASFDNIKAPFNTAAKIGLQTMHCSDCHGSGGSWTVDTGPNLDQVQGPHGSNNIFLLRGTWARTTAVDTIAGSICGNCHNPRGSSNSGLSGNHVPDGNMDGLECMNCHVAVPHGWKNKAFLANLGCVGIEAGEAGNCVSRTNWSNGFEAQPYYYRTYLQVTSWARSGAWTGNNCTSCDGAMKNCAGA